MSAFDDLQSIPPQMLADGYLAGAVHGKELTMAVVEIAPGVELPEHRHVNEQFGMVIEGSVILRIGDETRTIKAPFVN
jgi:quercetin dioxygenase-like cupin family protein